MTSTGYRARLTRAEAVVQAAQTCPWCHDRPHRYATVDADSGEVLSETMPNQCPACGRLPLIDREYVLEDARGERLEGK